MEGRTPPLLGQYLSLPPEASLLVLSGILGVSTNWLTLRYIYSYLKPDGSGTTVQNPESQTDEPNVILVSFLRDFAFWKDGAGRLVSSKATSHRYRMPR